MITSSLDPKPAFRETFRRNREKFIPPCSGCYVLSSIKDEVIYIGLADNLRRRFSQHLDSPGKTRPTSQGIAVFFYWLETAEINKLERTWMNVHLLAEGKLPVLNIAYSPTKT